MEIHQDDRRTLYDFANGYFKSVKAIEIGASEVVLGNHYHEKKDEEFLLLKGRFIEMIAGGIKLKNVSAPYKVCAKRGQYHKFICEPGSIIICVATEEYDKNDELK